ncbi:MAG: hypothetical protein LBC41_18380 [Clostridiales bacterium]|jgi:hypothetical protein|nr:hypothetical protein [Clostridiales bacterium]
MKIRRLATCLALVIAMAFTAIAPAGCGAVGGELTQEEAGKELSALLTKIRVDTATPLLDIGGTELTAPGAELPDISNYPLSVRGPAKSMWKYSAPLKRLGQAWTAG